MSIRLDAIGASVVFFAVGLPIASAHLNQAISPALAGIAIAYSVQLPANLDPHVTPRDPT
eukprot:7391901-Prymnesium_polylepis.5